MYELAWNAADAKLLVFYLALQCHNGFILIFDDSHDDFKRLGQLRKVHVCVCVGLEWM